MKTRILLGLIGLTIFVTRAEHPAAPLPASATDRAPTPPGSTPAPAPTPPELASRRTTATLVGEDHVVGAVESGARGPSGSPRPTSMAMVSTTSPRSSLSEPGRDRRPLRRSGFPSSVRPARDTRELRRRGARVRDPVRARLLRRGRFRQRRPSRRARGCKGSLGVRRAARRGAGSFAAPRMVALTGPLAAFAVGPVDREDGIADVVAAVDGGRGRGSRSSSRRRAPCSPRRRSSPFRRFRPPWPSASSRAT